MLNHNGAERVIASHALQGTDGESTRVRLDVDLRQLTGSAFVQARVFTRRWSEVTGYFFELIHE